MKWKIWIMVLLCLLLFSGCNNASSNLSDNELKAMEDSDNYLHYNNGFISCDYFSKTLYYFVSSYYTGDAIYFADESISQNFNKDEEEGMEYAALRYSKDTECRPNILTITKVECDKLTKIEALQFICDKFFTIDQPDIKNEELPYFLKTYGDGIVKGKLLSFSNGIAWCALLTYDKSLPELNKSALENAFESAKYEEQPMIGNHSYADYDLFQSVNYELQEDEKFYFNGILDMHDNKNFTSLEVIDGNNHTWQVAFPDIYFHSPKTLDKLKGHNIRVFSEGSALNTNKIIDLDSESNKEYTSSDFKMSQNDIIMMLSKRLEKVAYDDIVSNNYGSKCAIIEGIIGDTAEISGSMYFDLWMQSGEAYICKTMYLDLDNSDFADVAISLKSGDKLQCSIVFYEDGSWGLGKGSFLKVLETGTDFQSIVKENEGNQVSSNTSVKEKISAYKEVSDSTKDTDNASQVIYNQYVEELKSGGIVDSVNEIEQGTWIIIVNANWYNLSDGEKRILVNNIYENFDAWSKGVYSLSVTIEIRDSSGGKVASTKIGGSGMKINN